MITDQIVYFSATGALLGFVHTFLGPDHYIPFVFMSKARNWSMTRTLSITAVCGVGHVVSSVALGFAGIALGIGVTKLTDIESIRGDWAAWAFALFGFIYMAWGIYRAYQRRPHKHLHLHNGGVVHEHMHSHANEHDHLHSGEKAINITPWVLFIIFVLGPCEPLIPVIIYPVVEERGSISEAIIVSVVFSVVTIITMLTIVFLLQKGINLVNLKKLERYTHVLAGAMLLLSGIGILFLGL
ncbi:MAG: sulfite exporter TauE/SafE family protein [Bacteroidales bacterium]|nr:sulfite exporter TauE/SafE family protein [Bacteroidales bacterium]